MRKQHSFLTGGNADYCHLPGNIVVEQEEIWRKGQQKFSGIVVNEVGYGKAVKVLFAR